VCVGGGHGGGHRYNKRVGLIVRLGLNIRGSTDSNWLREERFEKVKLGAPKVESAVSGISYFLSK